jgi:iron complex outermembrane receptor protein
VGALLTLANANLGPERLVAGEGGVNYTPIQNLTWRSNWFVNRFTNPVSNVTIATNTRQRQNVSRTRIWGIQSEMDYRLKTNFKFGMSYLYNIAKVRASNPDASGLNITGNYLAEVPRHRGTAEVSYSNPKYVTASASMQIVGGQYDDDLNTLWLPYYNTLDFNVMRKIGRNMEVFFGVQNVLDREFYVQRVPTSVAAPRFFTGGLEISWYGR